jgi:hypothetical protein
MSAWRRKASVLFPDLVRDLRSGEAARPQFFIRLSSVAGEAHKTRDEATLRRVHGFAVWSLHQSDELWRNAAIGFYEDLFAEVPWAEIVPWLSPFVIEQVKRTWALGIEGERTRELDGLVQAVRQPLYPTHVFSTGEVDAL